MSEFSFIVRISRIVLIALVAVLASQTPAHAVVTSETFYNRSNVGDLAGWPSRSDFINDTNRFGSGTGAQSGDSVQLKYKLRLPDAAGGHVLDVVDWMYLAPNGNIMNRSQFRKFGFQVAELVATMRPARLEMQEAA